VTWTASQYADLVADLAVVALVGLGDRSAAAMRTGGVVGPALALAANDRTFRFKCLQRMLCQHYTGVRVNLGNGDCIIRVPAVAGGLVTVHVSGWINCHVLPTAPEEDDPAAIDAAVFESLDTSALVSSQTRQHVTGLLRRSFFALNPIPADEPSGENELDDVAAYLDRGGWCDCTDHKTPHDAAAAAA
jgi:hypothetical protein